MIDDDVKQRAIQNLATILPWQPERHEAAYMLYFRASAEGAADSDELYRRVNLIGRRAEDESVESFNRRAGTSGVVGQRGWQTEFRDTHRVIPGTGRAEVLPAIARERRLACRQLFNDGRLDVLAAAAAGLEQMEEGEEGEEGEYVAMADGDVEMPEAGEEGEQGEAGEQGGDDVDPAQLFGDPDGEFDFYSDDDGSPAPKRGKFTDAAIASVCEIVLGDSAAGRETLCLTLAGASKQQFREAWAKSDKEQRRALLVLRNDGRDLMKQSVERMKNVSIE